MECLGIKEIELTLILFNKLYIISLWGYLNNPFSLFLS